MEYTTVEVLGGTEVRMPAEHASDEDRREAHEWLVHLALPYYNRALAAERDSSIPESLSAAQSAVRHGAYVPRILKSAFLIATKHGDFGFARRLLSRIRELGLGKADVYGELLRRRVERWNQFLEDPAALRDTYQQPGVAPSYRELLLLADRLDSPPTETERTHLSAFGLPAPTATPELAPGTTSEANFPVAQRTVGLVAACLIGVLLGGGGLYWTQGRSSAETQPSATVSSTTSDNSTSDNSTSDNPTSGNAIPDSLVQEDRHEAVLRVSTLLASGKPAVAYRALKGLTADSAHAEEIDSLYVSTREVLYRTGRRAWEEENYERVVQALEPIRNESVGNMQDRLYRLGVAAAQIGKTDLAVEVLQKTMPYVDARHPHYEAQAAYLLAKHGSADVAQRYARLIANKYSDTLYFNSVVQAQLDES